MSPEPNSRWYHRRDKYRVTIADIGVDRDYSKHEAKGEHDAAWAPQVDYTVDDEFDGEKLPVLRSRPLYDFMEKFMPGEN